MAWIGAPTRLGPVEEAAEVCGICRTRGPRRMWRPPPTAAGTPRDHERRHARPAGVVQAQSNVARAPREDLYVMLAMRSGPLSPSTVR
jgi:hypothetical protein